MGQLELTAGRYRSLRLGAIAGELPDLLARAEANEVSYLAFADMLVEHERQTRDAKRVDLYRRQATFPSDKRLGASTTGTRPRSPSGRSTPCWISRSSTTGRTWCSSARRGWARPIWPSASA